VTAPDDFLSIVSHELRTPLTSIQGYSQLLEARLRASPERNAKELAHMRVIRSQVARMRRLVDDLLDVSRIERRGGVSIEPQPMDLAEELREVVARVRREHPARSVSFSAPESLEIVADRDRIAQVLGNLVDNALKYSPHGGPISLSASREADGVAVAVADAGLGISPEQRELVFERFYQADDDAGRGRSTGLGLGLYICRAIVESHGGWIRAAANEAAPSGTVVTFRLPLVAEPSLPPLTIDEVPPFVVRSGGDTER
jgi:signal transduction histidine kinase